MKQSIKELIKSLFGFRWNYNWRENYVISLFYQKGGFKNLYDFIKEEKTRMGNGFQIHYSKELLDVLEKLKDVDSTEFKKYIMENLHSHSFNKNNFLKLEEHGLEKYYENYSTDFRGKIVKIHVIGDYRIIETLCKNKPNFYNINKHSIIYSSLDMCLINTIFKGNYEQTLYALYEQMSNQ